MTAHEIARVWAAPVDRVTRWCQLQLLPATKTACGDWHIDPSARPVWRDGRGMLALFGIPIYGPPDSDSSGSASTPSTASAPPSITYGSLGRWA